MTLRLVPSQAIYVARPRANLLVGGLHLGLAGGVLHVMSQGIGQRLRSQPEGRLITRFHSLSCRGLPRHGGKSWSGCLL